MTDAQKTKVAELNRKAALQTGLNGLQTLLMEIVQSDVPSLEAKTLAAAMLTLALIVEETSK